MGRRDTLLVVALVAVIVLLAALAGATGADDRHGPRASVLAPVGEALRATLPDSDFGGRYGGEEFLMLLPGTDQTGAQQVAEKLRT